MAERIESLIRPGRPSLYPWATWTDGNPWRVTRGEDYDVPSKTMAAIVRAHGWRHGMRVSAYQVPDADAVEFQFNPPQEKAA